MAAKGESEWSRRGRPDDLFAAFVFMGQSIQSDQTLEPRPANILEFANEMGKTGDPYVFAHALVGPADLLVGVKAKSFGELAETIQRIRKSVDGKKFVHSVQCHVIVSIEGRIDFSQDYFRNVSTMRAWILANAATPRDPQQGDTFDLESTLRKNDCVKLSVKVLGGYDYFIYVEAADPKEMQDVIDQCIRASWKFTATDTRIVMHES